MQVEAPHATCGAKTRAGHPCKNYAMANGRCRMHGGKSLKGADVPSFKHGRHSKYLPKELVSIYNEMGQDTELLSLRGEIALMDAILANLLPNLDTGESGKAWETVKKLLKDARKAYNNEDMGAMMGAFDDMEALADQRLLHYMTEREIKDTVETRRKLVETEQKLTMQGERSISVEQLMLLMSQVLHVIQTVVTEEKQRVAIALKLQELISIPSGV